MRCIQLILVSAALTACDHDTKPQDRPNIVYILADDLGYGDLSSYNPSGKISTPNIDRLASQGMRFTDAHSPASVCTPSRYSILTGEYAWRSRLPHGVLRGYGRSLIGANQFTVGSLLQSEGYHTAVIGKWHLGLDWRLKNRDIEARLTQDENRSRGEFVKDMNSDSIDFTMPPRGGPLERGFSYSFILPASLDMEPYCYLENDTLTELPSAFTPGNDLETGYTGAFWRAGRMAPSFKIDEVLNTFTHRAITYLTERSVEQKPFFLYLPLAAPHTPWVPNDQQKGKSGAGQYGDFVQMVDDAIGKVLRTIDSLQLADNTIVIMASDNGPFWRPAFIERYGHRAAGEFRGMKADIFEGGHRVPLIVRWPGKVAHGSVSRATTTLTNLMATCADVLQTTLPPGSARDSYSLLPVLLGKSDFVPGQNAVIHQSSIGSFAIRKGKWKLIEGLGSGGFSEPQRLTALPGEPDGQLYDLDKDPLEMEDLYRQFPDKVIELRALMDSIRMAD